VAEATEEAANSQEDEERMRGEGKKKGLAWVKSN